MKIAVFGLGEAGSRISADIAATGIETTAYDPAEVNTPDGVHRYNNPVDTVNNAEVVIALTAGADAVTAIEQALDRIPETVLYADFSTNTVSAKQRLAEIAAGHGMQFADVALMGTVPGKGVRTPALVSGTGAGRFVETFSDLGMPVNKVSVRAGDAAARKLLRSVMMKGLAGTIVEAMRGAEKAGCADWLWKNLADEITKADEALLSRLVRGTGLHAVRRLHEMEASAALLEELGVDPVMTRATVENLRRVTQEGLPDIPVLPD